MHFVLDPQQIGFFFGNGHLHLSSAFDSKDCSQVANDCKKLVTKRLPESSHELSALQILFGGRDIWRDTTELYSFIRKGLFAHIASSLWWSAGGIRILYDQLIPLMGTEFLGGVADEKFFNRLITGKCNLSKMSAFSGILGGIVMCLRADQFDIEDRKGAILPTVPGELLCISDNCIFSYPKYVKGSVGLWYLVVFGKEDSRYILNENDPHAHRPKKMGYFLNDFLIADLHPFVRLPPLF